MNETVSTHIWNAEVGSEVVALEEMFCFGFSLAIPKGTHGIVTMKEKRDKNPDFYLGIEWSIGNQKIILGHPYTHCLIGLITAPDPSQKLP